MINLIAPKYKKKWLERKKYFQSAKGEIAVANIHLLRTVSIFATVIIAFFILATPYIVEDWAVTIQYLLFVPSMAVFAIFSTIAYAKNLKNEKVITIACVLFMCTMVFFLIAIDVVAYPDMASTFTPLFLAVSPALFILPYRIMVPYLICADAVFIAMCAAYKEQGLRQSDTFNSLVGLIFGLTIMFIVTDLRVKDYKIKDTYRDLSQIDGLTGVLNKMTCEEVIRDYIRTRELQEESVFLMIDLDNFKQINDDYGHHAGDQVLEHVGRELIKLVREDDVVGRFGGDEFVILLKNVKDDRMIDERCRQINERIQQLCIGEMKLEVSCSIGVAKTTDKFISYDELFQLADDALYEAKNFGKGCYVLHTPKSESVSDKKNVLLVVDDDEMNREIMVNLFKDEYEVMEAPNGRTALSILSQYSKQIAIVLLDIFMDDIDGYEVLRFMKARTHTQRIPVLVVTTDESNEEKVLKYGAIDMLHKPVDPAIVKLRVSNAVKRKM